MKQLRIFIALNIMLAAFCTAAFGQVVEGWNYCDTCDDARPQFVLDLVPAGTIGSAEIANLPCAPGDKTPFAGHAQFFWGDDGQPGLTLNDGDGSFSGVGQFALYDPNNPCVSTAPGQTQFLLRCQSAQIVATRAIPPLASPNCGVPPFGSVPITAYWSTAVISGVDEISGQRFEARIVGTRFIETRSCPLWVATLSVSTGLPTLHQNPPLEPSVDPVAPSKPGKGKGRSFGAIKDAFRK